MSPSAFFCTPAPEIAEAKEGVSVPGEGEVSSPPAKKAKQGKGRGKGSKKAQEEDTLGDGPLEAEDISEETVEAVVRYR